jgi:hypothetical protein
LQARAADPAAAADAGAAAGGKWPGDEKLRSGKREIVEAMARLRLDNSDPPDLLPRARRRK